MSENPLEDDPAREARIRERAYRIWEEEGRPDGQDVAIWERARVLVGMEESAGSGLLPNPMNEPEKRPDEAELQENLGEFPGQTDQGERQPTPKLRRSRRA